MSEALKENSSLELYETAYKLQYIDGNVPEACRIYKIIIDEFPNSNECGYAVIQLQKIQANDVADRIKTGEKPHLFSIIAALCAAACLIAVFIVFLSLKKVHSQLETLSLVSQALSIMYGGSDNDALEILGRAKTLSNGKMIVPYLLSANIYMNMQQYARARGEFEKYQKMTGKTDSVFKKMVTVKIDKSEKIAAPAKIDSLQPTSVPASSPGAEATFKPSPAEKAGSQPPFKQKPKIERPRLQRPFRKGAPGANPDSISFF